MSKENSRALALKTLYQINEEGAYANLALDKALFSCPDLDARDRGLVTEIVYGSVKNRGKLDYILNQFASTKVKKWIAGRATICGWRCIRFYFWIKFRIQRQ